MFRKKLSNYQENNQKLDNKLKYVENELQEANKQRLKIERVLKQATDSLVIALSVIK